MAWGLRTSKKPDRCTTTLPANPTSILGGGGGAQGVSMMEQTVSCWHGREALVKAARRWFAEYAPERPGVMGHLHHFSAGAARRPGMGSQGPESTSGLPRWQIAMHKRLRHAPIDHDRRHAPQAP